MSAFFSQLWEKKWSIFFVIAILSRFSGLISLSQEALKSQLLPEPYTLELEEEMGDSDVIEAGLSINGDKIYGICNNVVEINQQKTTLGLFQEETGELLQEEETSSKSLDMHLSLPENFKRAIAYLRCEGKREGKKIVSHLNGRIMTKALIAEREELFTFDEDPEDEEEEEGQEAQEKIEQAIQEEKTVPESFESSENVPTPPISISVPSPMPQSITDPPSPSRNSSSGALTSGPVPSKMLPHSIPLSPLKGAAELPQSFFETTIASQANKVVKVSLPRVLKNEGIVAFSITSKKSENSQIQITVLKKAPVKLPAKLRAEKIIDLDLDKDLKKTSLTIKLTKAELEGAKAKDLSVQISDGKRWKKGKFKKPKTQKDGSVLITVEAKSSAVLAVTTRQNKKP